MPRARRGWLILANGLLLAGVALALASFASRGAPRETPRTRARPPLVVPVVTFEAATPGTEVVLPARVKAAEEVTLAARIDARLTALPAREGARVRRGDPIAVFGAPETRRALAAAEAEADAAELSLGVTARQQARMESLFVSRVVAERDREVAADAKRSAEARLATARAALEGLASGSTVRAPFDGVVARTYVDPGADLVAGSPLVDLRSDAGREIVVDLPEAAVSRLEGSTLSVQIGDGPWRAARLLRLDGMTDWRTRSRTAHLACEGDAEPGAYARVAVGTAGPGAGSGEVPAASLVSRGALAGVFVVDGGTAHLRWIRLGRAHEDRVEVLAGLEPGERYALSPEGLVEGRAVRDR